jgi:hypothetical protein
VQKIEEALGIPRIIVSEILVEDLVKKRVMAKFVPWVLSQEQKEFCAEVAQDLLETSNKDPDFPKKVITGDESRVYVYDPKTKAQSSEWKSPESPCPKKAQPSWSNVKAILMFF